MPRCIGAMAPVARCAARARYALPERHTRSRVANGATRSPRGPSLGAIVVKRVLMVAYHFPPMNVSSGIQRTLRFAQYLPEFNWEPVVLTAHPRAYSGVSQASLAEVPPHLHVRRAFALDTARHLSLRGAYPQWLALPDRWSSWWLGAVPAGLALIRKLKPDVLWSTYPIATAHLIAYTLHRLTGIPWVADFRDPMAQPTLSGRPACAPCLRVDRVPDLEALRAGDVYGAGGAAALRGALPGHSGVAPHDHRERLRRIGLRRGGAGNILWPFGQRTAGARAQRNRLPVGAGPAPFFGALSELHKNGGIKPGELKVVLRATGCDDYLRELIERYGIGGIVTLEPAIPYRAALAEMLAADALLVLQAANCNYQVPAKLYEYLRARRPILALTDPAGGHRRRAEECGHRHHSASRFTRRRSRGCCCAFSSCCGSRRAPVAGEAQVAAASRRARTIELARVLDAVAG